MITIEQAAKGSFAVATKDVESKNSGKGLGSKIGFNPENATGVKDEKGGTKTPAYVVLAHELGHARAIDQGKQSYDRGTGEPGTTPPSERHSMASENMVRKEHGLPERPHYYDDVD